MDIVRYKDGQAVRIRDEVAVEAELAVALDGRRMAGLLRLPPESDAPEDREESLDLALGWLFTEGFIRDAADVASARLEETPDGPAVLVERAPRARGLGTETPPWAPTPVAGWTPIDVSTLMRLKPAFESRKSVQPRTGAAHSAVVFDRNLAVIAQAEDIGRHNALDKVAGRLLRSGRLAEAYACVMSSRQSREIVGKATRLGVEIQVGVSTVTTLAVELARRQKITLIGFFRQGRMNVYAHPERIDFSR